MRKCEQIFGERLFNLVARPTFYRNMFFLYIYIYKTSSGSFFEIFFYVFYPLGNEGKKEIDTGKRK